MASKAEREERSKEAVRLFVEEGLTCREIGRRLGCSHPTVTRYLEQSEVELPLRHSPDTSLEERLQSGTGPEDPETGCMEWTRGRTGEGYGHLCFEGKMIYAHRVALELKLGRKLKQDELTRHKCDNPPCVNPAHLEIGSHADNARDRDERGRRKGFAVETAGKAAKVLKAKELRQGNMSYRDIGQQLGVAHTTVRKWLNQ